MHAGTGGYVAKNNHFFSRSTRGPEFAVHKHALTRIDYVAYAGVEIQGIAPAPNFRKYIQNTKVKQRHY
jgi:hypothetical protein